MKKLQKADYIKMYTYMLKIRRFEELVLEEYKKGKIFGTVHTCIGQEVFPVILNEFTYFL